ncbi:hypothetical protein [Spirosoma foliorum]|uniref:Uncharacterized protein n=1 Tax=Spirosoma foliorum TaxID=2710596 RepID=A0A7G5GS51_9BACT|nr:hypothetical protein [Spirosoma foliorum]QMW01693.1 hypothetical protein H3H32_27640 [Spirosoma foliorum]
MNQGFKLRFDQMRDSNPTDPEAGLKPVDQEFYQTSGHTRNLCFIWPDGRRMFLNYAYLLAGEFEPDSDKNSIKLSFSSHTVLLQGFSLDALFMALLDHLPRLIVAIDPRYVLKDDAKEAVVIEITVEQKEA